MNILFHVTNDHNQEIEKALQAQLRRTLPQATMRVWPDAGALDEIDYAVVWGPPADFFNGLTQLKAIFSVAAGVDHLLKHISLPEGVPVVRLLDAGMGETMAEYALYGVLQAHRKMHLYRQLQMKHQWSAPLPSKLAAEVHIGLLGLGTLGQTVGKRLAMNGYQIEGWSRTEKQLDQIKTYHGDDGLSLMLSRIDILICVLPLTPQTQGILNANLFNQAKIGLYLINVARGGHLIDEDLLVALDTGQISGALLDVTSPEPLPPKHAFWEHPLITLTPHISAPTRAHESVEQIVNNIANHQNGLELTGIVDTDAGY